MSSPFNELKYKELLEGLEISELKLSEVKEENRIFRIDSNFFKKELVSLDKKIKGKAHFFIPEGNIVSGPFGSSLKSSAYLSEGIPFVRIENIKGGFSISKENMIYISDFDNNRLKSSQLFTNDLILSKVGNTIGFYARVDEEMKECNISENNIGIKLDNYATERKHFILTYLNTDIGYKLTIRRTSGNAQPKLNVFDVSEIPIPILSEYFEKKISKAILDSQTKLTESKSLYAEAEDILLSELGLKGWQPNNNPVNIKQLKESFMASGRLDAEYYQSKYDEIEEKIKSYSCEFDLVRNLFSQNTDVCDYSEPAYNYIEIGDINTGDGSASYNLIETDDLPDNAKRVIHKNDILVSKVRPYRGAVSIINFEAEKLIASGAFTVLHEKSEYKKEVLQVLLRTSIYKDWLLKWNVGSSYPVIKDEDIMNLPIPLFPNTVQTKIAEYVQKSMSLRGEAKKLLDQAKRMVEKEIEEGTF